MLITPLKRGKAVLGGGWMLFKVLGCMYLWVSNVPQIHSVQRKLCGTMAL